jgi:arginine N-succinyltransferase
MFRIRQSYREDAAQILAVAEHLDTVNLPADRGHIERILDRSEKSFSGELPEREREFVFVLEDQGSAKKVIGTSMIHAQHGTKRAPHVFFRVENDERYSYTLDRYFVHPTLRIGYNYDGPTEIGGLILLPEYRRSAESLGKALSYIRFLFIRMHRKVFRDTVLSELLPPLAEDGSSTLWEHLGRHFTGLGYHEADLLSKENKEFIHALFPHDPIHTELLPAEIRKNIGVVGPETKGVEKILRRIGFDYADQIDPFDGGPHFTATTDQITLVRDAREVTVASVDDADGERPWAVLALERPGQKPGFRGTGARVVPLDDGTVGVTAETRRRLGVEAGEVVWMAPG